MGNKPHYHSTVKASDTYRINMIVEIVKESVKKGNPVKIEYTKDFKNHNLYQEYDYTNHKCVLHWMQSTLKLDDCSVESLN